MAEGPERGGRAANGGHSPEGLGFRVGGGGHQHPNTRECFPDSNHAREDPDWALPLMVNTWHHRHTGRKRPREGIYVQVPLSPQVPFLPLPGEPSLLRKNPAKHGAR